MSDSRPPAAAGSRCTATVPSTAPPIPLPPRCWSTATPSPGSAPSRPPPPSPTAPWTSSTCDGRAGGPGLRRFPRPPDRDRARAGRRSTCRLRRRWRELLDAVAGLAGRRDGPVLGHGWDETAVAGDRAPAAGELERAAGGREVYLSRVDVHSAAVVLPGHCAAGLAALEGWRRRPGRTARPTPPAAPRVRTCRRRRAPGYQRRALDEAAANGYVALAEMAAPQSGARGPATCWHAGRPTAMPRRRRSARTGASWSQTGGPGPCPGRASAAGCGLGGDLTIDGSIGSRTAPAARAYADAPANARHPVPLAAAATPRTRGLLGRRASRPVSTSSATPARRAARRPSNWPPTAWARPRCRAAAAPPRARRNGRRRGHRAAAQLRRDGQHAAALRRRLGRDRGAVCPAAGRRAAAGMNAVGTFLAAGVPVCLGSRQPRDSGQPLGRREGLPGTEHQRARISARAAFLAHTRAGWRAAGEPNPMAGQLAPGTPATFAVWEADELTVQTPDPRVSVLEHRCPRRHAAAAGAGRRGPRGACAPCATGA